MRDRNVTLWALPVLAFALITTGVGMSAGAPAEFLAADLVGGLTFLVAGVVAAWLRPAALTGPLLILSSALWFIGSYAPTLQPVVMHLGFAFERYYDLVLAVLLLLLIGAAGRWRWLLVALGIAMAARSAGRLLFVDPVREGCAQCPPNPFALLPSQYLFTASELITNSLIVLLAVAVAGVAVVLLSRAGPATRRARWPILAAGVLAMGAAAYHAAEYAWNAATGDGLIVLDDPWAALWSWGLFGARVLVPVGFLVATLQLRGRAGAIGPLTVELDRALDAGSVGDALRVALGDPSLELLRPGSAGDWVDEAGRATQLPAESSGKAVTTVGRTEAPIAALVHDPALADHPGLLDGVVRVLRLALENERLEAELRVQLQAVTDSRTRLVEAAEAERRRVERDLHDGAQQRLVGLMLSLQQARAIADRSDVPQDVASSLDAAVVELNEAVRELRELARGIHPAILEEEGLAPAVAGLARRTSLPVEVHVDVSDRPPRIVESTAYFTIAEALTNAQRHAGATEVRVLVCQREQAVEVEVRDDGVGGADPARGTGLRGLSDRVAALGGTLAVENAPSGGTVVRAWIPLS
jgi:signal transduction histidine kinase